jgi:hypothetical protein
LRELGYEDGRNVRLAIRSAGTEIGRLHGLAAELVEMKVDVIVSIAMPPTREAREGSSASSVARRLSK